jgi:hypothetical protein
MTTSNVLFNRKEEIPDDLKLKKALGILHPAYKEVLSLIEGYETEWKFYGPRIGWQFKATHKGKALLYLTPQEKSFRLGFAVRDKEKEVLLDSKLPKKVKEAFAAAKKYPEGHPLHLLVNRQSDMRAVCLVVNTLKTMRQ